MFILPQNDMHMHIVLRIVSGGGLRAFAEFLSKICSSILRVYTHGLEESKPNGYLAFLAFRPFNNSMELLNAS